MIQINLDRFSLSSIYQPTKFHFHTNPLTGIIQSQLIYVLLKTNHNVMKIPFYTYHTQAGRISFLGGVNPTQNRTKKPQHQQLMPEMLHQSWASV